MGQTLLGGATNEGNIDLLTPEQKQQFSQAGQGYNQFLQPYDPQQFNDQFQKSFVEPAQQQLNRQIIPGIKENFLGQDESGSGSLNRALAQSATDVSTNLGQQYMNQYNLMNQNKLQALGGMSGLSGQRQFEPMISQNQGLLGSILSMLGSIGGPAVGGYFGRNQYQNQNQNQTGNR
jgi:hypothetical protein